MTGIRCHINLNCEAAIVEQDCSLAVFRIFQEAFLNVARHSRATEVEVSLENEDGELLLEIRDNGRGITDKEISHPRSIGLIGMKERALLFGGEVDICGTRGEGTVVRVSIPLTKREES